MHKMLLSLMLAPILVMAANTSIACVPTVQDELWYSQASAATCLGPAVSEVKLAQYEFSYEAWVRATPDKRYQLGRCIQNKTDRPLWISWPGVTGWVTPNDHAGVYHIIRSNCSTLEGELLYGAFPERLRVEYYMPKASVITIGSPSPSPSGAIIAPDFIIDDYDELTTIVRLALPVGEVGSGDFRTSHFTFTSGLTMYGGSSRYSYQIGAFADRDDVIDLDSQGLEIVTDPFILGAMRSQENFLVNLPDGTAILASGSRSIRSESGGRRLPITKNIDIVIRDSERNVLASFAAPAYVPGE